MRLRTEVAAGAAGLLWLCVSSVGQATPGWEQYARVTERPPGFASTSLATNGFVDVDFGREVAGHLIVHFGEVVPGTIVAVTFSETGGHLQDRRSDYSRRVPVDRRIPHSGEIWRDEPGCQSTNICADGFRGFRVARIRVERGAATIADVKVDLPAAVRARPDGWFLSSNEELNRIWYGSAYTVQLTTGPFAAAASDPRGCRVPEGRVIVTDGAKRDRCPWLGDQAVIAATMLTYSRDVSPVENTLALLASRQHEDGYIPSSPVANWGVELFDYPFYWVLALHDLYLHRANRAYLERWWPSLERVLDRYLPRHLNSDGLVVVSRRRDYGFLHRQGRIVAYYSAIALNALRAGAELARFRGFVGVAGRWNARADRLAGSISRAFWDVRAGAFRDTPTGTPIHPQDGNAFAALARIPGSARALDHLARHNAKPWGNSIADNDGFDFWSWGFDSSERVYPFISYFETRARFEHGLDLSAHDQLRRTWGFMVDPLKGGPGTMWEAVGQYGSVDGYHGASTSMASGWSSGGGPLLTRYMLGVRPTSPGYASFVVRPQLGDNAWARGVVPTPSGPISVDVSRFGEKLRVVARFPRGLNGVFSVPGLRPRPLKSGVAVTG
jgi:alpha-L-rhamnosidase-like protein